MVVVYYSKRIQIKISGKKGTWDEGTTRNQVQASSHSLLVHSQEQLLIFPSMDCESMCQILPVREAHLSLGVQGFYWRSIT